MVWLVRREVLEFGEVEAVPLGIGYIDASGVGDCDGGFRGLASADKFVKVLRPGNWIFAFILQESSLQECNQDVQDFQIFKFDETSDCLSSNFSHCSTTKKDFQMTQAERRIVERAEAVLEAGFQHMLEHDGNLPTDFEAQLEKALGRGGSPLSYKDLKPRMPAIVKHPRYIYVAVRYMESAPHCGAGFNQTIASQYKPILARIYGVKSLNYATIMEDRKAFWSHWPNEMERGR